MQLNIKDGQSINLINNLYSLPDEDSYYKKYKIRFPVDLINDKMKKVNLSLDELLSIKDNMEYDDGKNEKIIFDYIKYLDDLNDSLLLTIKALTPYPNNHTDIKEVDKWLKQYSADNYTKFKDATFSDNEFIRVSSNSIKHDDVRITSMSLKNHNNKKVYGFYISDILDENQLSGPKPEIHKTYKNTTTAFSFNHFLLRTAGVVALNFYWLNKITFNKIKSKPHNDNTISSFFKKLMNINHEFFPDEYNTKYAKIVKNEKHITIMYQKFIGNNNFDMIYDIGWSLKFNGRENNSKENLPYLSLAHSLTNP